MDVGMDDVELGEQTLVYVVIVLDWVSEMEDNRSGWSHDRSHNECCRTSSECGSHSRFL